MTDERPEFMSELSTLLTPYAALVDHALRDFLSSVQQPPDSFWGPLYYHLGWADTEFRPQEAPRGKRVRSAFCLMCCEAVGAPREAALPAGMALELLHEFSLVHDDIQDGDRTRRHRPTLWTVVGVPQAINAGDALFALAHLALLHGPEAAQRAERLVVATQRFNQATLGLAMGQHLDMSFEGRRQVTPSEYLEMVRGKTGALLALSGEMGALLGEAPPESCERLRAVGEALGMAFQMKDDLLALWGDPSRTGKAVGADLRAGKKSLPVAYALSQPASERLRDLYRAPLNSAGAVQEALALIESTEARAYVTDLMEAQFEEVYQHLDALDAPEPRVAPLRALVRLLKEREH